MSDMKKNIMERNPLGRKPTTEKQDLLTYFKDRGVDFGEGSKCPISLNKLRVLKKMCLPESEEGFVPYSPMSDPNRMVMTKFISSTLKNGANITIGRQGDLEVTGVIHDFRNILKDGTKTQLRFALSLEAVRTLTRLYGKLGLFQLELDLVLNDVHQKLLEA